MCYRKTIILTITIFFSSYYLAGQWNPTNGPVGGIVNSIIEHNGVVFAASGGNGGIYYLQENQNWKLLFNELPNNNTINALATNSSYIFSAHTLHGIFRSSNMGSNWEGVNNGISTFGISILSLHTDGDDIYAGSYVDGFYISENNGDSWVMKSNGLVGAANRIASITKSGNTLFISTPLGIYKSENNADSWVLSSNGIPLDKLYSSAIFSKNNYILAGTIAGLYRSTDNGETWTITGAGVIVNFVEGISEHNGVLYVCANGKVAKSEDDGLTWTDMSNGLTQFGTVHSILACDEGLFCSFSLLGVFKYNTSTNIWNEFTSGIANLRVRSLCRTGNRLFAVTEDADFGLISYSDDNGETWIKSINGSSQIGYLSIFSANGMLLAGSFGNFLYTSNNNGASWSHVSYPEFPKSYISNFAENNGVFFAASIFAGSDVYRSFDNASTWEATNTPGQGDIQIVHNSNGILYAGRTDGVFRTSDNGDSWTKSSGGLSDIPFIKAIGSDDEYIYTSTNSEGLWRSNNQGDDWELVMDPGLQNYVTAIANRDGYMFVSTKTTGIYYSEDYGDTWVEYSEGLLSELESGNIPLVYTLQIKGDSIYCGLNSYGTWVARLPYVISVSNYDEGNISDFYVYPNPANTQVNIKLESSISASCSISIFDLAGRQLLNIPNKLLTIGLNNINLEVRSFNKGVYIIEVSKDNSVSIQKLVVR